MPSLLWQAGFAFVGWKPAKDQLRDMLERMKIKVYHVADLPISFGGSQLAAYIETPSLNISNLIASLENHRAGVNLSVTFYSGVPDEMLTWWENLPEPTSEAEQAIIYGARANAPLYQSISADTPPQPIESNISRYLAFGQPVHVWHRPMAGSGWICAFDGNVDNKRPGFVLWVRAEDMRATP